jgi:ferredoxin-NADP reductase
MIGTDLSALGGGLFVLLAGANVWLMFLRMGPERTGSRAAWLTQAHRAGGYLYLALYLVMLYFMFRRVQEAPDELAPRALIHMILGLTLAPLLFLKLLIARHFKAQSQYLTPLGFLLFTLSFVLVGMTTGPYWLRRAPMQTVSMPSVGLSAEPIDLRQAEELMHARCGRCHNLDRVVGARKDAAGWLQTVNRMRALPGSGISEADARTVFIYLVKTLATDSAPPSGRQPGSVSAAPVGAAVAMRSSARSGTGPRTNFPADKGSPPDPTTGMVILGAVGLSSLLFWRRGSSGVGQKGHEPDSAALPGSPAPDPTTAAARQPVTLTLARIITETPSTKTFRFLLPQDAVLSHQAGQFLTFQWVVDGRKVARCYSISSSPSQSRHHLDITVKHVPGGVVSCYLHDRALIGLTVSARPPAGRFVLPNPPPRRLLCLAAGSGITPVMSILRWIDDACLPIAATLIYSVRTADEIIFGLELERLGMCVPGLRVVVTLTQPPAEWTGESGRLSRELIDRYCPDLEESLVYLCGPGPFMDAARALLNECGVPTERIRQESFGKPPALNAAPTAAVDPEGPRVEFARSGQSGVIPEGCTLLEAAEQCGVAIPFGCRQGQCGTCATRLLAGEVRMDVEDGLDAELRRCGYVLTCVGRAQGDVRLDA